MKPVDAREARRNAESKGFVDEGGDHYYLHFHYEGKKTSWRIKISRSGEYEANHIRKDARVCGNISANDLHKVVTCTLDEAWVKAQYEARMKK